MDSIANGQGTQPDFASRRFWSRPRHLLLVADAVSICVAALVGYGVFRFRGTQSVDTSSAIMAALIAVCSLALLARAGQYTHHRRLSALTDVGALVRDVVIAVAVATLLQYLTKSFFLGQAPPSRLATAVFALVFIALGAISRVGLSAYQRRMFAKGKGVRKVLLLGTGQTASEFITFVKRRPWLGITISGLLVYDTEENDSGDESSAEIDNTEFAAAELPIAHLTHSLTGLKRFRQILTSSGAAEVIVALDADAEAALPDVADLLSLAHVPFKIVPSLFEQSYRAAELLGYEEIPIIDVKVDPLDRVARIFKRGMDVCLSFVALILMIPVHLVVSLATLIDSGRPVVLKQERVGQNGRHFQMYKYRTMVVNAEALLAELRGRDEGDGPHFKMSADPRITRVGAFLRKWSMDEAPQFMNVLLGDMSVVGPRPPLPQEVEKYSTQHLARLKGKPGLTGLWQVSGRKNLPFDDMVRLDRYYLDNWSLRLDFGIIARTVVAVLTRKGAY